MSGGEVKYDSYSKSLTIQAEALFSQMTKTNLSFKIFFCIHTAYFQSHNKDSCVVVAIATKET